MTLTPPISDHLPLAIRAFALTKEPEIDELKRNRRTVKWLKHIPRAEFSQGALNEIGSALTLFKVSTNADEFLAALEGKTFETAEIDEVSAERVTEQLEESTEDFIIKRLKTSQTPYQFEHFIAHLLKCMGYHSRVTQASGDGGVDIVATEMSWVLSHQSLKSNVSRFYRRLDALTYKSCLEQLSEKKWACS